MESIQRVLGTASESLNTAIPLANSAIEALGREGFDEYADVVVRTWLLVDESNRATDLRPYRALRIPLVEVSQGLREFLAAMHDALEAGAIADAQRHVERIQPAIDRATDSLAAANRIFDAWRCIEESESPLSGLIEVAVSSLGSDGLHDLARCGSAEISRRIGDIDYPVEHGLLGSLLYAQAECLFDEQSFWTIVGSVLDLVRSNPNGFQQLMAEPGWKGRWAKSVADAYWASERFTATLGRAVHDEHFVGTVLDACHSLQEGVTKSLLATIRFVANPNQTYEQLLASGVANLAEWATANGFPEAAALSIPTRHAHAHSDWQIDGDHIVLCELKPPMGGPVRLRSEDLIDHSLAIQELTMATFLGVTLGAAGFGIDLPDGDLLARGASTAIAAALLAADGWSEVAAELVAPSAPVLLTCRRNGPGSIASFVPLNELFPTSDELTAVVETSSGERTVTLNLRAAREWTAEEPGDLQTLAFALLLRMTFVDGLPVAGERELRRIVCGVTGRWITNDGDEAGVVAVFRKARQVAQSCNDDQLLQTVKLAQGWRRSRLGGRDRPVEELAEYREWMTATPSLDLNL